MAVTIDGSAGITTNAGGSVNPSTNVEGINYSCRAWVNFNGTTSPITIRASGNVTNITDNGAGDYTVNFTTAMSDANYSAIAIANNIGSTAAAATRIGGYSTSSVVLYTTTFSTTKTDFDAVSVAIFR